MRLTWMKLLVFMAQRRRGLRRIYWTLLISAVLSVFVVPITIQLRNPEAIFVTGQPHIPLPEGFRELFIEAHQRFRADTRMQNFSALLWVLSENYPFLEMAERGGADLYTLANRVLATIETYGYSLQFHPVPYVNANFVDAFDRKGDLQLLTDGRLDVNLSPWSYQPYFFGYRDARFDNPVWDPHIPVREANFTLTMADADVAHVSFEAFIAEGHEHINDMPYLRFVHSDEQAALLALFAELDARHLILDLRGVALGFGEYFVPYLLAPNLTAPVSGRFYALHTAGDIARETGTRFARWHGFGPVVSGTPDLPALNADDAAHLAYYFPMDITIEPTADAPAFGGEIWLLVDEGAFSGPNYIYMQLAREAGFRILFASDPGAPAWMGTRVRLPHAGQILRFNPLYFTDALGNAFEEAGPFYCFRVEGLEVATALVSGQ